MGIRNKKIHLNRILEETKITFEESYTLLTQIVAPLNSRTHQAVHSDNEVKVAKLKKN